MSDIEPDVPDSSEASDEDADETVAALRDKVPEPGERVMTCPMCQGKDFEPIQLHGMNILLWNPIKRVANDMQEKQESKFSEMFGGRRVESYRCRTCDNIVMFTR